MPSYLLTWNPKKNWAWDGFEEDFAAVSGGQTVTISWRVLSKQIRDGDDLFLIRLGDEPRGIVASGVATSDSYSTRVKGRYAGNFEICELLDPDQEELLTVDSLRSDVSPEFTWTPQGSGIAIPDPVAERLKAVWSRFQDEQDHWILNTDELSVDELTEGRTVQVSVNAYERNRRARQQCIAHYGLICSVCDVSFGEFYGKDFASIIEVHHLTPLSEIGGSYVVDPVRDLRPVCPNCHAAIHFREPSYSIAEMRRILGRKKRR